MLIKMGAGGGTPAKSDAPKISFSGKWLSWHIEYYNGVPYWEAWFFSSGILTIVGTYSADAWGLGGGGAGSWSSSSSYGVGYAGRTAMAMNLTLTGTIPVTIGAGAPSDGWSAGKDGGATSLGSLVNCPGGCGATAGSGTYERYRFSDPDKAAESAGNNAWNSYDGWLNIAPNTATATGSDAAVVGKGIGAGAGKYGLAKSGALVLRIEVA